MSRSSRINKSTAVGALAACAVIGATSPVWADSGSSGSADTGQAASAQDATVIAALRAEVSNLKAQLHAEDIALHNATQTAAQEAKALAAAKADVAHLRALSTNPAANVRTFTVPTDGKQGTDPGNDPGDDNGMNGRHDCHDQGNDGNFGDHGDHAFNGGWRGHG